MSARIVAGTLGAITALVLAAATPEVETISTSPLVWKGQPLRAHTQGLEVTEGGFFVTARREDVHPRRALLLRYQTRSGQWILWDVTPTGDVVFDHPGGIQSDGTRLWIPIAESRRNGRSRIRAYRLDGFLAERLLMPELEFAVDDHIGALAVSAEKGLLFGASWDTESVYIWDLKGRLRQKLGGKDLSARGWASLVDGRPGLAVQDWKFVDGNLVASGLISLPDTTPTRSVSRLLRLTASLSPLPPSFDPPPAAGVPLSREGMAVSGGWIWFLPGDLGATNRLYRIPWSTAFGNPDRTAQEPQP